MREQIKLGHKVTIITSDWHNRFPNYDSAYKPIIGNRYIGTGIFYEEGIEIIRLQLIENPNFLFFLKGLNKTLKKTKPDLILCHGFEAGLLPLQAVCRQVPMIVDSHYMSVQTRDISTSNNFKRFLVKCAVTILSFIKGKYLSSKGVKFFGVTEEAIMHINKKGGIPFSKIKLIPLGANTSVFSPSPEIRSVQRGELNLKETDVLLCYTGKIEEYKGVHLILEALHRIKNENIYCLIVGGGSEAYRKKLDQFCESSSLLERVFFRSFASKEELNKYFNASDIAVYPKSVTISHIEAMAVGIPIIIEDLPGVQHRIKYENGFLIKENDIDMLAHYISLLSEDIDLRNKMGNSSLLLVRDEFNWEKINQEILMLIP